MFNSIIFFIKKTFEKYPNKFLFFIFLIVIDSLFVLASFASILPFADFIVDPELKSPNKLTQYVLIVFRMLDIIPSYFSFSVFFICTLLITTITTLIIINQTLVIKYSFEKSIAKDLLDSILNCKWSYLTRLNQGKILNIFTREIGNVGSSIKTTGQIFSNLIKLLIYLYVPFVIDQEFTLIVFLSIFCLGFPFLFLNKLAIKIGQERTVAGNNMVEILSETYQSIKLILGFNLSKKVIKNNMLLFDLQIKKDINTQILSLVVPYFFRPIAIIILLVVFGNNFALEKLPTYVAIFWGLYGSIPLISSLINSSLTVSSFYPSYQQITDVIDNCNKFKDSNEGKNFQDLQKEIKLENVNFSYNKNLQILNNCNIIIPAKKITTFIGKTGIGKSSIIDLLLGLQFPDSGKIYYDNNSLNTLNIRSLRDRVGYVPQDPLLFNTSIKNNILWANSDIQDLKIYEILENINAKEFIDNAPEKLETIVGERGLKISGGQRQKVALARAIARNPDILILDEALSSIDVGSAEIINRYLQKLSKKMTIINITHEIGHVKYADTVIKLVDGKYIVTENSTKNELLK
jgi:ABC-type multidrug transport system fused ATPase/permease subunit